MQDVVSRYELSKHQTAGYLQHGLRCRLPLARHLAFSSCKWRDMEAVQAMRNDLSKLILPVKDSLDAIADSQPPRSKTGCHEL
ncbi:MAG: hypothetical protein HKK67_10525 [Chlorobiaceae bacterium]|nr:hypothetical protein [Chlorobiaceae bacterium]